MPGSQKFSQNFHWKILSNFLMVSDVSLEMQSDSNNYVGLQDDEITEPVHTLFFFCPRRVLAQRPKPEEALIGPPAYKECEILV